MITLQTPPFACRRSERLKRFWPSPWNAPSPSLFKEEKINSLTSSFLHSVTSRNIVFHPLYEYDWSTLFVSPCSMRSIVNNNCNASAMTQYILQWNLTRPDLTFFRVQVLFQWYSFQLGVPDPLGTTSQLDQPLSKIKAGKQICASDRPTMQHTVQLYSIHKYLAYYFQKTSSSRNNDTSGLVEVEAEEEVEAVVVVLMVVLMVL